MKGPMSRFPIAGPVLAVLLLAQSSAPVPRVLIVPIVGELGASHLALVQRAVRRAREVRPSLIVVEIDTPGGRIDHMLSMGEALMEMPAPTVAYIRAGEGGVPFGAVSAGVYLAISCRRIYMQPGTIIGGALPVEMGPEGPRPVGEKYLSVAREKFRARSDQNGYPSELVVSMVDPGHVVYEIELDGKKRYVTPEEMDRLRDEGRSFVRPTEPYKAKDKLLTLTDRKAVEAGLARPGPDRAHIYRDYGLEAPVEEVLDLSWSERLVGFLSQPLVSFLLLVVGILGIWVELKTPGFGVPGVVGILAIALLLFGNYLAGLAEVPEIVLFAAGIGLLAAELLALPTGGILAVAGIVCLVAGLVLSFQDFVLPDPAGAPWQVDIFMSSIGRVAGAIVGASVGLLALLGFLPKVPVLGRMVLRDQIVAVAPAPEGEPDLVGRRGHAVTPLRPGGKIEVDGRVLDVVSEGEFVAAGEPVEILRVDGMKTLVRKTKR